MVNSPITNLWRRARTVKLDVQTTLVMRAAEGRAYHHHQHVLALDGRLYATFSSGEVNEDDVGQRVMFTTSDDRGQTWAQPRPIVIPPAGRFAPCVCTACGLHAARDGAGRSWLTAYYGQYEYAAAGLDGVRRRASDAAHENTATFAVRSGDGGRTWGEPIRLIDRFVPNLGPQPAGAGRLIMPGGVVYPYTDDPEGVADWTWSSLPGLPHDHVDDSAGFQRCLRESPAEHGYCEGSMFVTDDGVVHMMLRTNGPRLAVTESADNGLTWSRPMPTDFSDNASRHQFGRLPDGRFFALSTPRPDNLWQRTPLVLALGTDGVVFDRHFIVGDEPNRPPRLPGMHKGGRYGYPYMTVCGDTVVVLYSVSKEDVAASRFPLSALD